MAIALLVALAIVGVAIVTTASSSLDASEAAGDAVIVARRAGVELDAPGRRLVTAWLVRARTFRFWWSLGTLVVGGAVMIAFVTHGRLDLLWVLGFGLAGSMLGTVRAELFQMRRVPGPREATLLRRDVRSYRPRAMVWMRSGLAGLLVVLVAIEIVREQDVDAVVLLVALLAGAMAAVAAVVERAIVVRPRPSLPAGLERADDVIRHGAVASLVAASSGLLTLGSIAVLTAAPTPGAAVPPPSDGASGPVVVVLALVLWGLGIGFALQGRREVRPSRAERRAVGSLIQVSG